MKIPGIHYNPKVVVERYDVSSCKLRGAFGFVKIMALLPLIESSLSPLILEAITLANTLSPIERLYGASIRLEIGIVHSLFATIVESVPSQLVKSSEKVMPSFYLINT